MQVNRAPGWIFFPRHENVKCMFVVSELTSGNAEGSLKKAKEVMQEVQRWSEKVVPDKKEVLGSLHSCIGNALIELGDMGNALEHHQKDLELARKW